MKTLAVTLFIVSFLQATVLPLNLVLIILICRAYIKSDKANSLLAFAFGLLISHLNFTPLGFQSILYLIFIQVTESLSKTRLAGNPLLIVPICLVLLSSNQLIGSIFTHQTWEFKGVILESLLALPILYLIRLWEERFIVRKEIRLKV